MIELTWGEVRNEMFQKALSKVVSCQDLDFKVAYATSRIFSKIKSELELSDEMYKKLIAKHAEVDNEKGTYNVKPENMDLWKKEVLEFQETKFTIEKNKINVAFLEKTKLTPVEILALDSIVYDFEVIPGGKE